MQYLTYRGNKSTTYQLVLLSLLLGTLLVLLGKLTGGEWTTGVLGLVAAYVVRDLGARAAERKALSSGAGSP